MWAKGSVGTSERVEGGTRVERHHAVHRLCKRSEKVLTCT